MKKFQETGTPLTDHEAEENGVSAPLNSLKTRGKSCDEELQNLSHRSRYEQVHHAPGVERRSGGESLQDASLPGTYGQSCGLEYPKMQENPPGDGRRLSNVKKFDTQQVVNQKMTEFGFPRHPQSEESSPDAKMRSLSWFGQKSQRPGDPLAFCAL